MGMLINEARTIQANVNAISMKKPAENEIPFESLSYIDFRLLKCKFAPFMDTNPALLRPGYTWTSAGGAKIDN
jgi:hypothetical protein